MKRINRCNEVVKLLSAARCCAKAIVDVAAVKFRFGAVESALLKRGSRVKGEGQGSRVRVKGEGQG